MNGQPSRREFLRGKAADTLNASDALRPIGTSGLETGTDGSPTAAGALWKFSRRAMAGTFEICLSVAEYPNAQEVAERALDVVDQLEEQLSYFRATSELSRVNALAGQIPVPIEPRFFELLKLAKEVYIASEGAYDLTSAPLWELWGFAKRDGRMPTAAEIAAAQQRVGFAAIELDAACLTVRFLADGMRLNLGSIGKGYALDRAAEVLDEAGVTNYLLSGGYSSVLAAGDPPVTAGPDGGWTVGLRNPLRLERRLGELRLRNRGLSTSGSYIQSFRFEGKRFGHIIDPRSGWPAESVLSTTVIAPGAALAEALSTAAYVLGAERGAALCERYGASLLTLLPSRVAGGLEVVMAGSDVARWTPLASETTMP